MTGTSDKAVQALTDHARQRSADSRRRIKLALKNMRKKGVTININTVAKRAQVSRKTIYNNPDLRDQIHAHCRDTPTPQGAAPIESSIITALRIQLTSKDAQIKELTKKLRERDDTIARLYGHLETHSQNTPTSQTHGDSP